MPEHIDIKVFQDEIDEYRWKALAGNNRSIAVSGEGYHNQDDLDHALDLLWPTPTAPHITIDYTAVDSHKDTAEEASDNMTSLSGNVWLPREVARLGNDEGWRDFRLAEFVAIVRAESSFYEHAVGGPNSDGSMDYGLCQINSKHFQKFGYKNDEDFKNACFDAVMNVGFARTLYHDANYTFHPWAAYTSERYLKYIRTGILAVANFWCVQSHVELLYG